jgi:hypothetical protein
MKRILLASVLAALAMMVWGAIFWWTSLPYDAVKPVYDDTESVRFLKMHFPESGTYMIPGPHHDPDAIKELRETGPVATILIRSKKNIPSERSVFIRGLVQTLVATFLLSCLMNYTCTAKSYWSKVGTIALAGLAAAVYNDLADSIWWYQPWHWNLVKAAYDLTAWTVAGLVIARIVKPK